MDKSISNQQRVCSESGVSFVPKVPDECQSLVQSLEKVEWEEVYMQEVEGR